MAEPLVLYGGTFDPVHRAHLGWARAVSRLFGHCPVHLMPNAVPPHRPQPAATGAERLAMLRLACAPWPNLIADDWELRQQGPSWTLLTLRHFRREAGPATPIMLMIGADSLASLDSWHRWREYADLCHLVVLPRAGAPDPSAEVLRRFPGGTRRHLLARPAGRRLMLRAPAVPTAATGIREQLRRHGSSPRLTPEVRAHIRRHHLYNVPRRTPDTLPDDEVS